MGSEYKVHTKLLTGFETLGVMGENNSGIIKLGYCSAIRVSFRVFVQRKQMDRITQTNMPGTIESIEVPRSPEDGNNKPVTHTGTTSGL